MDKNINDCRHEALLLAGYDPEQLNDMYLQYLHANGATSLEHNDAEVQFLIAQGAPIGDLNDMWHYFLKSLGYTSNALNDLMYEFWCLNGGAPTPIEFCVFDLAFSDDPIAYIDCTKPPTLGTIDTYGTIKVNGLVTPWTVNQVSGTRIYFETIPPLVTGDVATYSYDPALDG